MSSRTLFCSVFLFQFLLISVVSLKNRPDCVHEEKQGEFQPLEIIDLPYQPNHINQRSLQTYQPIRIHFDYSRKEKVFFVCHLNRIELSVHKSLRTYLVDELMPPIQNYLQATLKVNQSYELVRVPNTTTQICNGRITLPAEYSSPGFEADLIIFVTAAESQKYVAYSLICLVDPTTNRPIAGQLVISTVNIEAASSKAEQESDMITLIHEITHILGFSSSMYSRFIDPSTGQALKNHVLTKSVYGMSSTVLNLPPLTTRLQSYFGCNTIAGAYLENQGTSASEGSHFERRIFGSEFMTAGRIADARISEFTLALLEGTGWYLPDYSMAEAMTYGKGQGCNFITGSCMDKIAFDSNFEEFCSPLMEVGCSWTFRGGAICGAFHINAQPTLKSGIDWWGNKTTMFDTYADNCPTYQLYGNTDCEDTNDEYSSRVGGTYFGYGSKCFVGTLSNPGSPLTQGSYCFKSTCQSGTDGSVSISVKIGSRTVICNREERISVPGMGGELYCPDPVTFCERIGAEGFCRRGCMGRGSCVDKVCECTIGWSSFDCSIAAYSDNCKRCAGSDPWKTSRYGDSCACNPVNVTCAGSVVGSGNVARRIGIIVGIVVGGGGIFAFGVIGVVIAIKRGKIGIQNKRKKVHQGEIQNEVSKKEKEHVPEEGSTNPTLAVVENGIPSVTYEVAFVNK